MAPRHVSFSRSNELVPPDGTVLCRDYRGGSLVSDLKIPVYQTV